MKKYLEYMNAAERKIADKLNTLTNINTFWDDVRKFTKNVHSDRSISLWQSWSEIRFDELRTGCEDVRTEFDYDDNGNSLHVITQMTIAKKYLLRRFNYGKSTEIFR